MKICVVTVPPQNNLLVRNFVKVLEPSVDKLVLISGNYPEKDVTSSKIKVINFNTDNKKRSIFNRTVKFAVLQFKIACSLVRNLAESEVVIFFLDGGVLLLPMLVGRLFFKKTIRVVTHSTYLISRQDNQEGKFYHISLSFLEYLSNFLSSKLIVYSPHMISNLRLNKHKYKIIIAHEQFIDFGSFYCQEILNQRKCIVGYIGRFSEEKGILNFVQAIPILMQKNESIHFLLIGNGRIRNKIENYINKNNLSSRVQLLDFVPHDELSKYLNLLKLIVIPSYTEGLPNIMLESMSCGTPVLATPVGAIPDIIKDGQTGFIMENNSPECIAQNIIRVLNYPGLEQTALNEVDLMRKKFSLSEASAAYKDILFSIAK